MDSKRHILVACLLLSACSSPAVDDTNDGTSPGDGDASFTVDSGDASLPDVDEDNSHIVPCPEEGCTECVLARAELTGRLVDDVVGTWLRDGCYGESVLELSGDGTFREVKPVVEHHFDDHPNNTICPAGSSGSEGTWTLEGETIVFDGEGAPAPATVGEVTPGAMRVTPSVLGVPWLRVACAGPGFGDLDDLPEPPAERCSNEEQPDAFCAAEYGDGARCFELFTVWGEAVVCGFGHPFMSVSATELQFGDVVPPDSASRTLTVGNWGHGDLEISSLTLSNPAFSVDPVAPLTVPPDDSADLTITFTPPDLTEHTDESLTISSNAADDREVDLHANRACVDWGGDLPSPFLGDVAVGESRVIELIVRNCGVPPVTVTNVTIQNRGEQNDDYTLMPPELPVTLGAGETVEFTVTFVASSTDTSHTAVSVETDVGSLATRFVANLDR